MASDEVLTRGDEAGANFLNEGTANALIQVVYKIRGLVDFAGRWASLLFVPMIVITVYDVCLRKTGKLQIDIKYWAEDYGFGQIFESTLLQESEWHCHTALFALVLGFGVIFAAIPLGLKFASVAGLNPIGVFFIYLAVFWIVYFFIYLRKR